MTTEGGCSCHINPPCNYCTSRGECELCGKETEGDYMKEVQGVFACEDCFDSHTANTLEETK